MPVHFSIRMMQKYNLFLLKNQKWQSTPQCRRQLQWHSLEWKPPFDTIFSILGAEQLHNITPINIHLSSMGGSPK